MTRTGDTSAGRADPGADAGPDRPWARVPSWVGEALRPELAGAIEEIITVVRADVPDYARPMTGRFGARITEAVTLAIDQFLALLGRDQPVSDVRLFRSLGRLEHTEGRTMAALQATYQVSSRTLWRRLGASPLAATLPPEVIFRLAEALFTYIQIVSTASTDGWAAEEDDRAGSLQARRHAVVELMARTPPVPFAEIERAAAEANWYVPPRVVAVAADDAVAVANRLPGAVGANLGTDGVVVVGEPDRDGLDRITIGLRGRRAVLGPAVDATEAHRSVERARAVWALLRADRLSSADTLVRAEHHLLDVLLAADPDTAQDLRQRALEPLWRMGPGRAEETLVAWLDAHGDVTATAAALHVHPQTVRYRLTGLRSAFGDALDDPVRRLEVALALRIPPPPPT